MSNNTDTATWAPTLTVAKEYQVYAKWRSVNNRASNAQYTINHTTGSASVTVNQKLNGGVWNLLDTYTLDAGSTITLNDQADGYVIADAIRLVGSTTANVAPSISNTAPINNAEYTVGNSISVTADATDTDGTVTQVQFFDFFIELLTCQDFYKKPGLWNFFLVLSTEQGNHYK